MRSSMLSLLVLAACLAVNMVAARPQLRGEEDEEIDYEDLELVGDSQEEEQEDLEGNFSTLV
jgi:hypothetical protein